MKKKEKRRESQLCANAGQFFYLSLFQDTEMGYVLLPLGSLAVGLRRFPTFFQADRVLAQARILYSPYWSSVCPGPTHLLGTCGNVNGGSSGTKPRLVFCRVVRDMHGRAGNGS